MSDRQEGKREAGEVPARSRHCNCGAVYDNVTERSGRLYTVLRHKSGNLPFVGTRPKGQGHEVLIVLFFRLSGEGLFAMSSALCGGFLLH